MDSYIEPAFPSLGRIIAAQVTGLVVMVFSYWGTYFVAGLQILLLIHSISEGLQNMGLREVPTDPIYFILYYTVLLLPLGIFPALIKLIFLKSWIKSAFLWTASETVVTAVILFALGYGWQHELLGLWEGTDSLLTIVIVNSISYGFLGGLVTGAAQSFWLQKGKIHYWFTTTAAWVVCSPMITLMASSLLTILHD